LRQAAQQMPPFQQRTMRRLRPAIAPLLLPTLAGLALGFGRQAWTSEAFSRSSLAAKPESRHDIGSFVGARRPGNLERTASAFGVANDGRAAATVARRASLEAGDTILVAGAVSPTGMIVTSMLKGLGYDVRPVLTKTMDPFAIWGMPIRGFVPGGGEPTPAAAGLVVADEKFLQTDLVVAFVKQIGKMGNLKRVTFLSAERARSPLENMFGNTEEEERRAREDATLSACKEVGAECTVVRTGVLRGGGSKSDCPYNLGQEVYMRIIDSVSSIEEELFDLNQRGAEVTDAATSTVTEGGKFGGPFGKKSETARTTAAAAVAEAFSAESAADKVVDVVSVEGTESLSSAKWADAYSSVAVK